MGRKYKHSGAYIRMHLYALFKYFYITSFMTMNIVVSPEHL